MYSELAAEFKAEAQATRDEMSFFRGLARRHRGSDIRYMAMDIINLLIDEEEMWLEKAKHCLSIGRKRCGYAGKPENGASRSFPQG